jgi:hypothetical protein
MPVAEFSFGEALLTVLSIFVFVAWIMVLFTIIGDLFRDHEMSGWGKAIWILFLVFLPFLTGLIYLIARGSGMRDRALAERKEAQAEFNAYVKQTAGTSHADELAKLSDLKAKGDITEEEFQKAKSKLLD